MIMDAGRRCVSYCRIALAVFALTATAACAIANPPGQVSPSSGATAARAQVPSMMVGIGY